MSFFSKISHLYTQSKQIFGLFAITLTRYSDTSFLIHSHTLPAYTRNSFHIHLVFIYISLFEMYVSFFEIYISLFETYISNNEMQLIASKYILYIRGNRYSYYEGANCHNGVFSCQILLKFARISSLMNNIWRKISTFADKCRLQVIKATLQVYEHK